MRTDDLAVENRRVMDLTPRRDGPALVQLGGHLALIALTVAGVVAGLGSWWLVPAMLAHGIAMSALFAPLHESVHRTVFRGRRANDWLAAACGAVLVLPACYYRPFHMEHHRFTQDLGRDPELLIAKPRTVPQYLVYVSGWHYWWRQVSGLFRHAAGRVPERFLTARDRPKVVVEARLHLALYAALAALVAAGWAWPLWLWAIPMLLGQPFLRLYLLAEHTGCPYVADIWRNTRTTYTNAAIRRLMWNMPYHAEHHAFPAVPFHALPALNARMRERWQVTAPGYTAVHRELVGQLR